jgi:hypothetical protein
LYEAREKAKYKMVTGATGCGRWVSRKSSQCDCYLAGTKWSRERSDHSFPRLRLPDERDDDLSATRLWTGIDVSRKGDGPELLGSRGIRLVKINNLNPINIDIHVLGCAATI